MPSPPASPRPPSTPTVASYMSRAQSAQGMGQRPNKLVRPITGASRPLSTAPSLLGGV